MNLATKAETLIAQADKDGNGNISFEEFYDMLSSDTGDETPDSTSAWKMIKLWMQFSSGWSTAPKTPEELLMSHADPNMKIISFIRHGQSEANEACDRVGSARGYFNPHLTEVGRGQANIRKDMIASNDLWKFELIVVSPMQRTLETFELACADYIGKVKVVVHPLVREHFTDSDDIGDAPTKIKEAWSHIPNVDWSYFPDIPEVWWYTKPNASPDSMNVEAQRKLQMEKAWSEPWPAVVKRAHEFEAWLRTREEKNICVVSHGGFIEALVGPRMDNAQHCVLQM